MTLTSADFQAVLSHPPVWRLGLNAMNATGNGTQFPCVADHGVGIASIIYALFVVLAGACCLKFARLARRDRWESKGHFYGLALSVRTCATP